MVTVKEIYSALDARFPRSLSCSWDNDGLMVCPDMSAEARNILLALDATDEVAEYAAAGGFDTVITHHPLIFSPLPSINENDIIARRALKFIKNGISVMSFHTRLDAAEGGVNDALAALFSLSDIESFGPCGEEIGRIGTLPAPIGFRELCSIVKDKLGAPKIEAVGKEKTVRRIALLGGNGKDFISSAAKAGADAFMTGEANYNSLLDAASLGLCVITAGHYYTEVPVLDALADILNKSFTGLNIKKYPNGTEIFTL